jgi:hypothetical protein
VIIRVNIEHMDKCELIIKKYNPNAKDGDTLKLEDQLTLTGEDSIDVNDIKGKFILDKISELNGKSKNPDENDIDIPKEPEPPEQPAPETPPEGETPPQSQAPPQTQGGPPAQEAPPSL